MLFWFIVLVSLSSKSVGAVNLSRNSRCTTPNGEVTTCIPLDDCSIISNAIKTRNTTAINFAKESQCGYDKEVLMCCGSSAYPGLPDLNILFTKDSPTTTEATWHRSSLLPDRTLCGLERETDRILGGTVTRLDEFPWMALLRYQTKSGADAGFLCGGSLINTRYVLTAAHCLIGQVNTNYNVKSVRLGEWDYDKKEDCIESLSFRDCADPVVDVNIEEIIPHSFFSSKNGNNDIGLLRLERHVNYTEYIRPICLPPENFPAPPHGKYLTVAGWGSTENGTKSSKKLKVKLPIVNNVNCTKALGVNIGPNKVCAGGMRNIDSCSGDSGGPLMYFYTDSPHIQQWYQEGIVSRGRQCGVQGLPGIYTRTSRYTNWIIHQIRD